jgi:nitroreductase
MDAIEAMKSRVSVRNYEQRPVPREVLEDIADCGRLAPTGRNEQAWTFVVVTEPGLRAKLAEICRHRRARTWSWYVLGQCSPQGPLQGCGRVAWLS